MPGPGRRSRNSRIAIKAVDSTAIHELQDLIKEYHTRGITFVATGFNGPVRDKMQRSGLMDLIGADNYFLTVVNAMNKINSESGKSKLQQTITQGSKD